MLNPTIISQELFIRMLYSHPSIFYTKTIFQKIQILPKKPKLFQAKKCEPNPCIPGFTMLIVDNLILFSYMWYWYKKIRIPVHSTIRS